MRPTLGRIVHYRGKYGLFAMRAAVVNVDVTSLDQRGVDAGDIPPLSSDHHAHLWVFTPGESGGFQEYDVAEGVPDAEGKIPPGTWCWPPRV